MVRRSIRILKAMSKMLFISHRGNIDGKNIELENSPSYIDTAIEQGYQVEIDIWLKGGIFFLGHDSPIYPINSDWIDSRASILWLHCKNIGAIEKLAFLFKSNKKINFFWHENDLMTMTSLNYLWVFPGKQIVNDSIAVLPELFNDKLSGCVGICSDFIKIYRDGNL